jgi:hydrogenase maturation protease
VDVSGPFEPPVDSVTVDGVELRAGSRVRLHPRRGGDVFDLVLEGRTAVVDEVIQNVEGDVHLAVRADDDPGRDVGGMGHRFFFAPDEVEPVAGPRVLVAGIGNLFLGDDGFGVEVAAQLASTALAARVHVEDYGIRGMDLAYALAGYDVAILVDAVPRGEPPGTLYVIEPDLDEVASGFDAHGMDPVKVLALARELGGPLPRVLVVGCEPATRMTGEEDEVVAELSEPVRAAVGEAVRLIESLVDETMTRG